MKKLTSALEGAYKYYEKRLKISVPRDYFPSCDDVGEKMLSDKEEFNRYIEACEKFIVKKSDLDAYLEEPQSRVEVGAHFDG